MMVTMKWVGWCVLVFGLWGCASTLPQQHQYLLSDPNAQASSIARTSGCRVQLSELRLPRYLLQPALVLRQDNGELLTANHHRWAEPVIDGATRVLARCLNPAVLAGPAPTEKVQIVVTHMHGDTQGTSILQARWQSERGSGSYEHSTRQPRNGYASMVSTQRQLLLGLCERVLSQAVSCQSSAGSNRAD